MYTARSIPAAILSLLSLSLLLMATGCAQPRAELYGTRPAQIGLPGVRTLAVAPFEVRSPNQTLVAEQARQCLLRELLASSRYQVLDAESPYQVSQAGGGQADAMIRTQVNLSLHDRQLNELAHVQDTATKTTTVTHPDGTTSTREETVTMEHSEQVPGVHRQAEARLVLTAIDPETGALVGSGADTQRLNQTYGGAASLAGANEYDASRPALYQMQSADRDLAELACRAASALGQEMLPQSYVESVTLDIGLGDGPAEQGAWLADEGNWEGAARIWSSIPQGHPEYAPALYNLGLYWEAKGTPADFLQARELYAQARAVIDQPLYQEALIRIDQRLEEARQLSLQSAPGYVVQ